MSPKSLWRPVALLAAMSMVAVSCGDADDATTGDAPPTTEAGTTTEATAAGDEEVEATGVGDGVLTFGTLLPITGDLSFLGPLEVAGARLAVEDINAAGGVWGSDVRLIEGDSGDTNTDIANPTTDRLLSEGADVIIGAASSAVSKLVIDKITGAGVIQFSPANTSDDFTDYPDNGLYFRTAPPDVLQGQVLADLVAREGNATMGIIYRQESYGEGLANRIQQVFADLGGEVVESIAYSPDTENFDPEVDRLVAAAPDAIVVVGFNESASILTTMHERGVGPQSDTAVYGVDGNIGGIGAELSDPSIIAGMRGTEPSVDVSTIADFTARLDQAYEGGLAGVYTYGAETYDAMIITALAAEIAGTDDPIAIAAEINDVTRDGTTCTSFAECKELIDAGEDIDYDGIGGPYDFIDAGEPAAGSFRIATYDGGTTPNSELDEYIQARLQ
jgi:ABC-type branched-subunit amino acid transport system substrate-binding protein